MNDFASMGDFVWSDGEPVVYENWNPGEPQVSKQHTPLMANTLRCVYHDT